MPGFTSHYLFGVDAFKRIPQSELKSNLKLHHGTFALGLQGPDIFFYYMPSYLLHRTNLGVLAHDKDTGAFFAYLLESRKMFDSSPRKQAIADAYICGFLGHYSLDCTAHPYIYAFTNFDPNNKPSNSEYFGQHAYFETELDKELLWMKKHLYPSQFHQNNTIFLSPLEKQVVGEMLSYAYKNAYNIQISHPFILRGACGWMYMGTRLLNDPSGQKKVLARYIEKLTLDRAFISPMVPSDLHTFVEDPLNYGRRTWVHPWTKKTSNETFLDLYSKASNLYDKRLKLFAKAVQNGFTVYDIDDLCKEYGNRSFLSGLPLL